MSNISNHIYELEQYEIISSRDFKIMQVTPKRQHDDALHSADNYPALKATEQSDSDPLRRITKACN